MWSKYGRSRNSARSNSFRPQPVSGVESLSIRERTPFAIFDDRRFTTSSRRSTRQPANSFTCASARWRAARGFHAAAHRGALSRLGQMPHDAELRKTRLGLAQHRERVVLARVVDVDDLEVRAAAQRGADLLDQRDDVVALVMDGDDDGQF